TAGPHTLDIEVTQTKRAASTGYWVWIDGFDITVPPAHFEQTDPSVVYTGPWAGVWFDNTSMPGHSGGSAKLAMDQGSRATFSFSGTGVTWVGFRDPWAGIARVFVDGALQQTVDTYAAAQAAQQVLYSQQGLTRGAHTLAIEVTQSRSA